MAGFVNLPVNALEEQSTEKCATTSTKPAAKPGWVKCVTQERFFQRCTHHVDTERADLANFFCIQCTHSACPSCVPQHNGHTLLQIRRSSYHEVCKVNDIAKLLDTTGIQSYVINSSRVMFLNPRPHPRASKMPSPHSTSKSAFCLICSRGLQSETSTYCSLACKADWAQTNGVPLGCSDGEKKCPEPLPQHAPPHSSVLGARRAKSPDENLFTPERKEPPREKPDKPPVHSLKRKVDQVEQVEMEGELTQKLPILQNVSNGMRHTSLELRQLTMLQVEVLGRRDIHRRKGKPQRSPVY